MIATVVLFSGLGNIETAQETISVGVETVAGSAIMLLTVPWGLLVFAGWVDIMDDTAQYKKIPKLSVTGAIKTTYLSLQNIARKELEKKR